MHNETQKFRVKSRKILNNSDTLVDHYSLIMAVLCVLIF